MSAAWSGWQKKLWLLGRQSAEIQSKSGVTMVPIDRGRKSTGSGLLTFVTKMIGNRQEFANRCIKLSEQVALVQRDRSAKAGADLLISHINTRVFANLLIYSYASIPQVGRYANAT
jgi:hypothetical protein